MTRRTKLESRIRLCQEYRRQLEQKIHKTSDYKAWKTYQHWIHYYHLQEQSLQDELRALRNPAPFLLFAVLAILFTTSLFLFDPTYTGMVTYDNMPVPENAIALNLTYNLNGTQTISFANTTINCTCNGSVLVPVEDIATLTTPDSVSTVWVTLHSNGSAQNGSVITKDASTSNDSKTEERANQSESTQPINQTINETTTDKSKVNNTGNTTGDSPINISTNQTAPNTSSTDKNPGNHTPDLVGRNETIVNTNTSEVNSSKENLDNHTASNQSIDNTSNSNLSTNRTSNQETNQASSQNSTNQSSLAGPTINQSDEQMDNQQTNQSNESFNPLSSPETGLNGSESNHSERHTTWKGKKVFTLIDELTLNLSKHIGKNLTFLASSDYKTDIQRDVLHITAGKEKEAMLTIYARRGTEIFEYEILLKKENPRIRQNPAHTGKPVQWERPVEDTIRIPDYARNARLLHDGKIVKTIKAMGTASTSINRSQYPGDLKVVYETPAPEKREITKGNKKQIIINSSFHYKNVTTQTSIQEHVITPRLYHYINGTKTDVTQNETYNVTFHDTDNNSLYDLMKWTVPHLSEQRFETGLASVNTNKSRYHPGEMAGIAIVVLDSEGFLVSDAQVSCTITKPDNTTDTLTGISETKPGIYTFDYLTSLNGTHDLDILAIAPGVNDTMHSSFLVEKEYPFEIIREAPMTTDPWQGPLSARMTIIPESNATYRLREHVPENMTIIDTDGSITDNTITWNLSGESTVTYTLQPPLETPDLYSLRAEIESQDSVFYEARPWFIAIDPIVVDMNNSYYDDLRTNQSMQDHASVRFNASIKGGVELDKGCISYPLETGCWNHKREITVEGGSNQSYPFSITLDTKSLIQAKKMQADCSDIRITWNNVSEQNVYFWVEEGYCNTQDTTIWIRAPKIDGSEQFNLYYANPNASTSSYHSGDSVFPFFDDFNQESLNTSRWIASGAYNFPAGAGYVEYWTTAAAQFNEPSLTSVDNFSDGTLYWRLLTTDSDGDFDGAIGVREPNSDDVAEGIFFMLDSKDANDVGIVEMEGWNYLSQFDNFVPQDLWIRSKAVFDGSEFSFYNDYHGYEIEATSSTYADGHIEAWCDSDNNGKDRAGLDWIAYLNRTEETHKVSIGPEVADYVTTGNLTTDIIDSNATFTTFSVDHQIPSGTNITYRFLNDGLVCQPTVAQELQEYDISGCSFGYDNLSIEATLETKNQSVTPRILEWALSWYAGNLLMDEPDDSFMTRFTDFYANGTYTGDDNISIQYKKVGGSDAMDDSYEQFNDYTSINNMSVTDRLTLLPQSNTHTWYDQAWPARFSYNVTGKHIRLELNDSDIDFSRTDFTDIRITYLNSSKHKEELIPHWVQSANASHAVVWSRIPEGSRTVFVYYGNPAASDTSDGDQVFDFFESFGNTTLDTDKWIHNEGSFTITDGEFIGQPGDAIEYIYTREYSIDTQKTIEFAMRGENIGDDWRAGIGVGAWNFLEHYEAKSRGWNIYDLVIDRNRWGNDLFDEGTPRSDSGHHQYQVGIGTASTSFNDTTQQRGFTVSQVPVGPIYIVNDGPDEGTIIDWIFVRDNAPTTVEKWTQENASFSYYGNYTSDSLDTNASVVYYDSLEYESSEPAGTNLTVYTRTSDDDSSWTTWKEQNNSQKIASEGKRYLQYLVEMETSNESTTPVLDRISINYKTSLAMFFTNMTGDDVVFAATNPYSCSGSCTPEWTVTPKQHGKFVLRLAGESPSNEKIVYVFADTSIDLTLGKETAASGEEMVVSGRLIDDLGKGIGYKDIKIQLGSTKTIVDTDEQGYFSAMITIPDLPIGNHSLVTQFDKDYNDYYNPTSASDSMYISSKPNITNISVEDTGIGQVIHLNVTATDTRGIDAMEVEITRPDGTVDMHSFNQSLSYKNTWDTGTYTWEITVTNVDGIENKETVYSTIQGYATAAPSLQKDSYQNHEDVFLSDTFRDWNKKMGIDTGSNQTVVISLDGGFEGWSHTDGSDIVFYGQKRLPHWVKSWNDDNATILVRTGATGNITMYYDGTLTQENKSHVFDFYDDVSTDKEVYYTEEIIYDRGANDGLFTWDTLEKRIIVDDSNDDMIAYPTQVVPDEFVAEVVVHGGDDDGIGLFVQDGEIYYEALISNDFPNAGTDGIFTQTVSNPPSLIQSTTDNIDSQVPHKLTLRYEKGTLSMYVDETLQATYDVTLTPDAVGFVTIAMDGDDSLTNFTLREIHNSSIQYEQSVSASRIFNIGDRPIQGYRWATVQYYNGLYWENLYPAPINDIATSKSNEIANRTTLDAYYGWNNNPWNTGIFPHGEYRVKLALVKNTTHPERETEMITDSDGDAIVGYDRFRILQAYLWLANLTHENTLNEYETTDTIEWINITLFAKNNTAFDSEVTLTLLDKYGIDYVGFGPDHETKQYGDIAFNSTKTRQWDDGYPIPEDVDGSYIFHWDVMMDLLNGPLRVNRSEFILIHNLRDDFERTNLTRQYQNTSQLLNVSMVNEWSRNLSDVQISVNCPTIANLSCACESQCSLPTLARENTAVFNITTGAVSVGDYDINVTIRYTNPGGEYKVWDEILNQKLEIREQGVFSITEKYAPNQVVRGNQAKIQYYAMSSNSSQVIDAQLNITIYPDTWSLLTPESVYAALLEAGERLWNNATFDIPISASLGEQVVRSDSAGSAVKSDFKQSYIDVYAATQISQFTISDNDTSRGEEITLRARLLYDNSTPIVGHQVYFFDETDNVPVGSGVTDSDGWAEKSFTPDSLSLGMHTLNVSFAGSDSFYLNPSVDRTTMRLGLKPTIHEVKILPEIGYGMNQSIDANITDDTAVAESWALITYPNGSVAQVTLQDGSGHFTDTWFNGTYALQVYANDTSGSVNHSQPISFTVSADGGIRVTVNESAYDLYENVTLKSTAPWWNEDYTHRKEIQVSGNIADYTMEVTLDTRSMRASGDDLRVVWFNGSHNIELDRINKTPFDAADTKILFPLRSYGTYYAYYGNPEAGNPPADPASVYYFYEDFNRDDSDTVGGGWTQWGATGETGIQGGRLEVSGSGGVVHTLPIQTNFTISFDMDIPDSGDEWWQHIGIGGSQMSETEPVTDVGPALHTSRDSSQGGNTVDYYISRIPSMATADIIEDDVFGEYTYELFVQDETFDYLRDGVHAVDDVAWADSPASLEQIRVYSDGAPAHYYDNIIVTLSPPTDPVYQLAEEETFTEDTLTSTKSFKGELVAQIQRYDDTWQTVDTHITQNQTIEPGIFDLSQVWTPWDTQNSQGGTYRVYAYMQTPYNDTIVTNQGLYEGYDEFTILAPQTYVTIDELRVYEVTPSSWESGGSLVDSGLSKTFTLFANQTYRVEIQLRNHFDSQEWDINKTSFSHAGLDGSWEVNETEDIWYRIGYGGNEYNGSWNGSIGWDTHGEVPVDTKLTLSYVFNSTTRGDYPVLFTVDDALFTKTDESTYHVITRQQDHPHIYDDTYGLTRSEMLRGESNVIYARWDQEIAEAQVYYNATIPGIISDTVPLPEPNPHNWTNHTLASSDDWLLGEHVARIQAKNPSGYWNDTLAYLTYQVYGIATAEVSLNTTYIDLNDTVNITCTITDDTNSSAIAGYTASIYADDVLLHQSPTDNQGIIDYLYKPEAYGLYDITCNITAQENYQVDERNSSKQTLFVREFQAPRFHEISGPQKVYKGNQDTYSVRWTDNARMDAAYLALNLTGSYENVSNTTLASNNTWANIDYTVPLETTPGVYGWKEYGIDTSNNMNQTPEVGFEVWGYAGITDTFQKPASVQISNHTESGCHIEDMNTSRGIEGYNVTFYRDGSYLGWNLTNTSGWATYRFNDSGLGLQTITCNITDQNYYNATIEEQNLSLNVVNTSDIYPPALDVYGINDTELVRQECMKVYGRWDEQPSHAKAIFNVSDFVERSIPAPYPGNWTNLTLCTNNSWTIGRHAIKLWANDSNRNINDTVPFLFFNLSGQSRVDWYEPAGVTPRGFRNLSCRVTDADTTDPLPSYLVQFYDSDGYLGAANTDESGTASLEIDLSNASIGYYDYQCSIQNTQKYTTVQSQDSAQIEIINYLPITLNHPFDGSRLESRNIEFRWTPESDIPGETLWCNLSLDGSVNATVMTESHAETTTIVNNISYGEHNWSVFCWHDHEIRNQSQTNAFTLGLKENTPPEVPFRLTPQKDNYTVFERRPFFSWEEAYDANADNLSYNLYVELLECSGPLQCSVLEINQTNITSLNYTHYEDLDYDSVYSWKIQAYDGIETSNWSTRWNFSIESQIIVTLANDNVSFGVQRGGEATDTTDDENTSTPDPFIIRNDGNVNINIHNISAQDDLWESPVGQNPSRFFQIKADNSSEVAAFDFNQSVTDWVNVSSSNAYMIREIMHHDTSDEAEIEVRIIVPWEEPPGKKQSTLIFYGEPGE
ncbi:MAG: DUF2341 domain-containing protein [Nanobdellota archaeon]